MPVPLRGTGGFNSVEDKGTYDRKMLARAKPRLVHNEYGLKATIPPKGGTWIEWRRMERITATTTAITEGTVSTETIPTVITVTATVAQYAQFFRSTDLVNDQAYDPIVAEATEALGESMGDSLDQLTRDVMAGGTTVIFASTAGSRAQIGSGMRLTSTEIRKALATIETNNAQPLNGVFPTIIHTRTKYDLFGDTNIVNAFLYAYNRGGDNPLATGRLGNYLGAEFVVTSNAKIFSSLGLSGANVYATLMTGADSYGVVSLSAQTARTFYKAIGSGGATGDPVDQVWSLGWKANHAAAILNQTWLVRIEHTSAFDTGYGG